MRVNSHGIISNNKRYVGIHLYSVPLGLEGRRVQVALSLTTVVVFCEHHEVARHVRSFLPADVVMDPAHARALRMAREATRRLQGSDVTVGVADLAHYDALVSP